MWPKCPLTFYVPKDNFKFLIVLVLNHVQPQKKKRYRETSLKIQPEIKGFCDKNNFFYTDHLTTLEG